MKRKSSSQRLLSAALKSLVILGIWGIGGQYAQACQYDFAALLSATDSAVAHSGPACTQYAVDVPKSLTVLSGKPTLAVLQIGETYFCYKEARLVGYSRHSTCKDFVPAKDYYSDLLAPGQEVRLWVEKGRANVAVSILGERP